MGSGRPGVAGGKEVKKVLQRGGGGQQGFRETLGFSMSTWVESLAVNDKLEKMRLEHRCSDL